MQINNNEIDKCLNDIFPFLIMPKETGVLKLLNYIFYKYVNRYKNDTRSSARGQSPSVVRDAQRRGVVPKIIVTIPASKIHTQ